MLKKRTVKNKTRSCKKNGVLTYKHKRRLRVVKIKLIRLKKLKSPKQPKHRITINPKDRFFLSHHLFFSSAPFYSLVPAIKKWLTTNAHCLMSFSTKGTFKTMFGFLGEPRAIVTQANHPLSYTFN